MDDPSQVLLFHAVRHLAEAGFLDRARLQVDLLRCRRELLARPRYGEPGRLQRHGAKIYSQNDEDGLIAEVLRRIGPGSRTFLEFGVADGVECNTLALLMEGWRGVWAEADPVRAAQLRATFGAHLGDGSLQLHVGPVTAENVGDLVGRHPVIADLDVLSIDVDGNDLWVWRALRRVRPRVVVIEYNATWPPPLSVAVPYHPDWKWDGSNWFGASLVALERIGREKGYRLIGCCLAGVNALFVREDLVSEELFHAPFTAEEHYEPARYHLALLPAGHRPGYGPLFRI